jgi:DNA-binding transcriptional LysR family regulator
MFPNQIFHGPLNDFFTHHALLSKKHSSRTRRYGGQMATQAQVGELEIGLLRAFLLVVQQGSIGKAAAVADMTQPAVSQQMLKLEKIVGQKLFDRGRNGVILTKHGEMLVDYATRVIDLSEETLLRLREQSASARVVFGCTTDVALVGFIPALKRSQSIHPELEIKTVVTSASKLETLLKDGELDFVITNVQAMTRTPMAKWNLSLQWCCAKNLRLDKSQPLPLVFFEKSEPWQDSLLASLRNAGWEWKLAFESSSIDAVLTAVQSGLGIAVLPMRAIRSAKLVALKDVGLPPAPTAEFGVFTASTLSSYAKTVLDVTIASLSD